MKIADSQTDFQNYPIMEKSWALINLIKKYTSEAITCRIPSNVIVWLHLNPRFEKIEFNIKENQTEYLVGKYDNITFIVSAEIGTSIFLDV